MKTHSKLCSYLTFYRLCSVLQDFKFQFELYIANMSGAQKRKLSSEKKEEEMKKFQKLIKCSVLQKKAISMYNVEIQN